MEMFGHHRALLQVIGDVKEIVQSVAIFCQHEDSGDIDPLLLTDPSVIETKPDFMFVRSRQQFRNTRYLQRN